MAIKLSKPALAALGLLKTLGGGNRDSGETRSGRGLPDIEGLVEAGEEVYDALLLRSKERRDRIHEDIKNGISKILSDLGVATRDEIRDLRDHLDPDAAEKDDGSDHPA